MKYKYIGTEQQLIEHGFYLCKDNESNIIDKDYLRDVDDDVQTYISLEFSGYNRQVINNFNAAIDLEEKHFNDLIKDGLVIKEEK